MSYAVKLDMSNKALNAMQCLDPSHIVVNDLTRTLLGMTWTSSPQSGLTWTGPS